MLKTKATPRRSEPKRTNLFVIFHEAGDEVSGGKGEIKLLLLHSVSHRKKETRLKSVLEAQKCFLLKKLHQSEEKSQTLFRKLDNKC